MPRRPVNVAPVTIEEFDPEDPRIEGKDPTMIPGHPRCNYEKYFASEERADIVMQGDYENRQFTTYHFNFNGYRSPDYPYNQMVMMPMTFARMAMLTGKASTSHAALKAEVEGQKGRPWDGEPLPGPFSGEIASTKF